MTNFIKKLFTLAFASLFISSALFAESAASNAEFKKVCQSISSHKITKGSFSQTKMIKKIKREIKSSGVFIVSIDDGVLWNTQKPFASSMAISSKGIVQTAANGKKTVTSASSNATFEQVSSLMTSLFNGDINMLDKNFDMEFIGDSNNWNVNLTPKDASIKAFISTIEMAGKTTINSMVLNEASGDFTKYEFSNQTFPSALTKDEKAAFSDQ